jgi:hypothetical protein
VFTHLNSQTEGTTKEVQTWQAWEEMSKERSSPCVRSDASNEEVMRVRDVNMLLVDVHISPNCQSDTHVIGHMAVDEK